MAVLLPHVLLALGQAVPASAASGKDQVAGSSLVTCVVYRYGAPSRVDDDSRNGGKTGPDDRSFCPVCQSGMLCQTMLPVRPAALPIPTVAVWVRSVLPNRSVAGVSQPIRLLPRGPPSIA